MGEFAELDDRFRDRWGKEYTSFTLRLRRATSWGRRGDEEEEKDSPDHDAAFIFYWIAFNALYGEYAADDSKKTEWGNIQAYLVKVVNFDEDGSIYRHLWGQFEDARFGDTRQLLNNRYIFDDFWDFQHALEYPSKRREAAGSGNWEDRLADETEKVERSFKLWRGLPVLYMLFRRLYVLRNQLLHGSATWGSRVNREQVTVGTKLMKLLLPIFVALMLDNPNADWGKPYYPLVKQPDGGA